MHLILGRIAAEEARRQAIIRAKREQHTRIKVELKQAIQLEDREKLELSVHAVKKEKVGDWGDLLAEAERLLGKLKARGSLRDAIVARRLAELERAVEQTRKGGFETDLRVEMTEARALLDKLHRLEQKRKAVLNLSQRVIAEIKSYAKPPAAVHTVLSATFLLLGTPESETKSWPATQVMKPNFDHQISVGFSQLFRAYSGYICHGVSISLWEFMWGV